MLPISITYLLNSGFLLRVGRKYLIFDDWQDPVGNVDAALEEKQASELDGVYFFASHAHPDHFDAHIADYADRTTKYILSHDIRRNKKSLLARFPEDKIVWMHTYDHWEDDGLSVDTYSSTDAGVSFLVTDKATGARIFHAGDFNWWDWEGEEVSARAAMEKMFRKQLSRMDGLKVDLAFFPVDGRLEGSKAKGAYEFARVVDAKYLVTMHSVGYPRWQVPADFFAAGSEIPVWSPVSPGEQWEIEVEEKE